MVYKKICKKEDSHILSSLLLYVAAPSAIIKSFQIEKTSDNMQGFLLAVGAAVLIHIIFFLITKLLQKRLKLSSVEKASIIYSNSGNFIMPLVTIIMGNEMVFYTSGYIVVQIILLWTHGKFLMSKETTFDIKKILFNVNIISIFIGILLFLFEIPLPTTIQSSLTSLSSLMGPLSMLVIGMLLVGVNFKQIFTQKRLYLIPFLRLILLPVLVLMVFVVTDLASFVSNGELILLVSLLAASAPIATTIANFAVMFDNDSKEASVLNAISVLLCIITMPLITMLYSFFIK